jgi:hypothetical protein
MILHALSKGSKSNKDYVIDNLLAALNQVRTRNTRHKVATILMVHMDNSTCDNGAKITEKMSLKGLGRAPYTAYSPDISPCDFWAFGTIQEKIRDRHFQGSEEILKAI